MLVKFKIIILLLVGYCCAKSSYHAQDGQRRIICYYESWAVYRPGKGLFDVHNIDPNQCTHGMYAFAGLNSEDNTVVSLDPYNDFFVGYGLGGYHRFVELTKTNPEFIPMLSVGGWNEGSEKYSKMASTSENRKSFVDSAVQFLDTYGFKGLDLDWEYPTQRGGVPEDKDNYVQLLKELREAFDSKGYILSAAVSAGKDNIDSAYDIPNVAKYLHFINLMSYDYHGDWEPYTGENAPLYASPSESGSNALLNVNFSTHYWISGGAPAEKINLGLAAYGRSFTLANPLIHGFYAPTTGPGQAAPYTDEAGDLGYNEVCELFLQADKFPIVRDESYQAPYTFFGDQWISYDDVDSIKIKCEFAIELNLGGVMVWSVDTDDFHNTCGGGAFPLMTVVNQILKSATSPSNEAA